MTTCQTASSAFTSGRYVYCVEKRSGRGRNFIRETVSTHELADDAARAMTAAKVNHEGGWRWVITKQWRAA